MVGLNRRAFLKLSAVAGGIGISGGSLHNNVLCPVFCPCLYAGIDKKKRFLNPRVGHDPIICSSPYIHL